MTKSYKIRAYNLKTGKFLKEYRTMLELAEDFDLTLESVKSYFYRYKLYGEAKIRNHNTNTWCYLEREETKKVPNYKDRCEKAIDYIKKNIKFTNEYPNYAYFKIWEYEVLLKSLGDKENE